MSKRIKFLKTHNRHQKGEIALIVDAAANYLIRVGVAIEIKDDVPAAWKVDKPGKNKEIKEVKTKAKKPGRKKK